MKKLFLLVIILANVPFGVSQKTVSAPAGVDSVSMLDRLPLLRHGVWFHSVSSQDVTGGNNDGFLATFSNQYVEDGQVVLLDTRGPGCIQLVRTAHYNAFTGAMNFQGDLTIQTRRHGAQQTEVLPFPDLYSGKRAPFLPPLIREEREAHGVSSNFVPICSEDGIKVSTENKGTQLFYDIFYHSFSKGAPVEAFSPAMDVRPAIERWKAVGAPLDARPARSAERKIDVPAGTAVPVYAYSGGGTITALQIKAPSLTHELLRYVRIRAYWDGEAEASVDSPLGPFFGTGYWPVPDPPGTAPRYGAMPKFLKTGNVPLGRVETRSLPVGAGRDGFYNFFPMPFFKSARIDLVNESTTPISGIEVTVQTVSDPPPENSAYFHARWREENPTLPFRDYTVLDTRGQGHYVGAVMVMSSVAYDPAKRGGASQRGYLEGDARFYIDDKRTFENGSTGTEEFFLCGWYDIAVMDNVFSYPVNGYPVHDIDGQDHTVMYRFQLSDLVPYYRSFRFALEHGPEGATPSNYSGTAFYYQVDAPGLQMTAAWSTGWPQKSLAYSSGTAVWRGCRDLPFEGDQQIAFNNAYKSDLKSGTAESLGKAVHACGERVSGPVEFTVPILPENAGVKLRRMLDYATADLPGQELDKRQKPIIAPAEDAEVFIDGNPAGRWHLSPRHARLAWLEDDFEIPASVTAGKREIKVRLEVAPKTSWSAFEYRVYSYTGKN